MSDAPIPLLKDQPGGSAARFDDARARYNARLLSMAQALYSLASINMFSTAALAGQILAPAERWATLPITTYVIGTALFTWPAAHFMQRFGRRAGFLIGASAGIIAGLLATWAIFERTFLVFVFATFLQGIYQAFAQYYRFAATDVASPAFRPRAVSWVLMGSIAGALFGPVLISATKDLFEPVLFAGNFAAAGVITLFAAVLLSFINLPRPQEEEGAGQGESTRARPLRALLAQPRLRVAVLTGMLAYGMMNLLMTATPLAMVGCGFTVEQSSWVIQWHVLAMYAPSFMTGALIARHGAERIAALGLLLTAVSAVIHLLGVRMENFGFGLVLLGLGWNFAFIAATTMVAECHAPADRARVQGFNDLMVFSTVALTSFLSGQLYALLGWKAVNFALFPMLALAAGGLAWLAVKTRGEVACELPPSGPRPE